MLRNLKKLFLDRQMLKIDDIANHFRMSESALEGMLKVLIRKKFIEKVEYDCGTCSSSCKSCIFANQKDVYKLIH